MNRPDVSFSSDGTLKNVELKIMNLRPGLSSNLVWEEIGVWKSYEEDNAGLDIKDIVWPGHSHVPPQVRRNDFETASIRVALVSQLIELRIFGGSPIMTKKLNFKSNQKSSK